MSEPTGEVPFAAHIELLRLFLAHRGYIVEKIQDLLSARPQPAQYLPDRASLFRHVEDCFFTLPGITAAQLRLRGQLQQAHWASGFRPRDMPEVFNDLIDPGEMMARAFNLWRQTRWPGRSGRLRYAQTLFNLYLLRNLELLVMRLWDAGADSAGDRLSRAQGVLDQLWESSPADQPVLVRDARWLIPVAQSPTTDDLRPYFRVAAQVANSFGEQDRLEIHRAGVAMAGGHLRSQLRHFTMQGTALADPQLMLSTRGSNALDFAMTVQGLVPLLQAYELATQGGEPAARLELADAICQGLSADPQLFVNRLDLLAAYTMIEQLFIVPEQGRAVLTPMGQRHVDLLERYTALIGRVSPALAGDCLHFRPLPGRYSPYGIMFGFSTNISEHMALQTLQAGTVARFSLEDAFTAGDADKLAWVSSWRRLPHISADVQKLYEYPQQFAADMFARVAQALRMRAAGGVENVAARTGRLFIMPHGGAPAGTEPVPELPVEYVISCDPQLVAAQGAQPCEQARLLRDRGEGMYIVSYRTPGGWTAISKDVLTAVLGAGRDARIAGLPEEAAAVLRLMCPGLVEIPARQALGPLPAV
ncbi:MAG TPA: hypothetical protein VMH77_05255 [Steroidobacteraceae bacterium]|nr:hypothetical protein [Steroidobacteraceae bacterium]